jgi:hypothetical protein
LHPRCPKARERWREVGPPLQRKAGGGNAGCHYYPLSDAKATGRLPLALSPDPSQDSAPSA